MSRKTRRTLAALIAGVALPVGAIAAAAAANAAVQKSVRPEVEVCGTGRALVRPHSMVLTCADDGELAVHLHWSGWNRTRATATGRVTWRNGTAASASTRQWKSASARFTLLDPVREASGKVLFTRLRMHVTGATPKGFIRNLTFDESPTPAAQQSPSRAEISGRATPSVASAPSGTLSYADIEGYWIAAGGSSSTAKTAAAITGAESSFYPGIIQQGVDYCDSGTSDEAGWGLWQITCGNSESSYGIDYQILDPWNNAEAAVAKYKAAGGFSPWSTYTSGAYKNYLESVSPNTSVTDPGEYKADGSAPPGTPSSPGSDPGSTYGPAMPSGTVTHLQCNYNPNSTDDEYGCAENEGNFNNAILDSPSSYDSHFTKVYVDNTWFELDNYGSCLQAATSGVIAAACDSSNTGQLWKLSTGKSGFNEYVNDWATTASGSDQCLEGDESNGLPSTLSTTACSAEYNGEFWAPF